MHSSFSITQLATPGVQALQPYAPGKPLAELAREYGIADAVKLASNENPLGPSPRVLEALTDALGGIGRYPDGNGFELKNALSAALDVPADWITLGNGSNDVLEMVARAFLSPAHNAVFSDHAFAVYPIVTCAVGASAHVAPAHDGRCGPAWGHDLDAMAARIDAMTRLVFIANPNNPTGTFLKRDELSAFISAVPEQVIVVVDQAYFEYLDDPDYPDAGAWLAQHPNLLVTRTFSKAYGLAGLRIGYGVSQPELADLLNRVRQPFNINGLAQVAAQAALDDASHLRRSVELNREGLALLAQGLDALGLDYIPSVANFICVDVGREAAPVYEALLHEGVIVRPLANYGMPRHLRVSVGLAQENRRALAAFEKVLA